MKSLIRGIITFMSLTLTASPVFAESGEEFWQNVEEESISAAFVQSERRIIPDEYRTLNLDLNALKSYLGEMPEAQFSTQSGQQIKLPSPNGGYELFLIHPSEVMAPELAAQYPEIKTYSGIGVDNPNASIKLDVTAKGFHAMVLSPATGSYFIDPYAEGDTSKYISYYKKNFTKPDAVQHTCSGAIAEDHYDANSALYHFDVESFAVSDNDLRTYRLAVATTYEYSQFHGGTKQSVMSAVVTTVNRVTGLYERDLAVKLVLVPGTDKSFFLTSNDPYTNSNGSAMLSQNQTELDSTIGRSNYDIGHVFSTGGGGVAYLGSVCGSSKAGGVTGQSRPVGDPFDIDYVAHEMGHQFGANHTQNNACNRSNASYEVGSGITVMGYAGICPPNAANNSDAMFHAASLSEIRTFITNRNGSTCAQRNPLSNSIPTANAGSNYTIPKSTPFTLTGTATDNDGTGSLTYSWEQFDNEVATQPPKSTNTSGPAFKTFLPSTSPSRTFPKMAAIIANNNPQWEVLASVGRTYNFRFVVRDNNSQGGFIAWDDTRITVSGSAGPFRVNSPNTAVTWPKNGTATVTWDVAGTASGSVNSPNVNILLSTDGGKTYPHTLASNVPNDGSQQVTVPDVTTNTARIQVQSANNVFFDISNVNFAIQTGGNPDPDPDPGNGEYFNKPHSALKGQEVHGSLVVSSTPTALNFSISGGTGDADLYVRFGSKPTTSSYDCRPWKDGNIESCDMTKLQTGTYYVMLRAYNDFTNVTPTYQCTGCDGSNPDPNPDPNPGGTWAVNVSYSVGNQVTYGGATYECVIAHTSNSAWTPDVAFTLWKKL